MSTTNHQPKDHWSARDYNSAAGFVPKLTSTVISYLNAQPNESILDVGCGDGQLTAQVAQSVSPGKVLGIDSSKSFINTAQEQFASSNSSYLLHDGTALETCPAAVSGQWDKVFSNAAMHWILRNPITRKGFFANVHKALKSNGQFVFEMGGKGNVAEIHAAAISALVHAGVSIERARDANPWFFPSVDWMSATLTEAGFEVEKCELEYRPTKLTAVTADGKGGIEGWVRLMCAQFLEVVPEQKRNDVVKEICETLETIITREEDGSKWVGYVRLRAIASKT